MIISFAPLPARGSVFGNKKTAPLSRDGLVSTYLHQHAAREQGWLK
jgi:hypothetical protein